MDTCIETSTRLEEGGRGEGAREGREGGREGGTGKGLHQVVGGGDSPSGIIWEGGLTCKLHMVCMLPCVARVRRCGQQERAVHSRDRGTDIACLIPDSILSLRLCVCVHAFVKDRVYIAW